MASYSGQYAVILVKRNGDGRIDQTLETGFEGDYDYCRSATKEYLPPDGYEVEVKFTGSYDDFPGSSPYLANRKGWLIGEHGTLGRPFGSL